MSMSVGVTPALAIAARPDCLAPDSSPNELHLPENGKIVTFTTRTPVATEIASGAPLLVDVEFDRGHALYALSQGHFTPGHPEGSPADPNIGALESVHRDRTMTPVVTGLNQPMSLEFIHDTAYIVTLNGEVWPVDS
jgi:hypothetical protein